MSEEKKPMTDEEIDTALFSQLIVMLATSVMQQLGKIVNPATGKSEVSLEGAAAMIDLLTMLERKTKGNLSSEEQKLMNETLTTLRLNFVETSKGAPQEEPQEKAQPTPETEPPTAEPSPPSDEKPDEKKEPKFHKKYD